MALGDTAPPSCGAFSVTGRCATMRAGMLTAFPERAISLCEGHPSRQATLTQSFSVRCVAVRLQPVSGRFWPKKCIEQMKPTGTQRCEQFELPLQSHCASWLATSCEGLLSETGRYSCCRRIGLGRGHRDGDDQRA